MSYQAVTYSGKLDAKNLPMINQHYLIPLPSSLPTYASARDKRNAVAIQSMWKHFLDQVTDPPVRLSLYIPSHLALSSVLLDQVSDPPDCLSLIHIPPSLTIHLVTPCIPSHGHQPTNQLAINHLRVFLPSHDASEVVNTHTNRPRLPIFIALR